MQFSGRMIVVDLLRERQLRTIGLRPGAMPQDVKLAPDGRVFYVADMMSGGVWLIDAHTFRKIRFEPTGRAPTASIPAATPRPSTSPTAARARSA